MKLYEIEEAHDLIKHINGMLLMFGATSKTNEIVLSYLRTLIIELQDQEMIDAAQAETEEEINFDNQVNFLKYLVSNLEERESQPKEPVDKSSN